MEERLQRWTAWAGGPSALAAILVVQVGLAGLFLLDPKVPVAVIVGFAAVVVVLSRPLLGIGLLIVARLLSTGATVFFRIGHMGIGPFEPALVLCAGALAAYAVTRGQQLYSPFPWRAPFVGLVAFVTFSLGWCVDRSDGIGDTLPLYIVLANILVILSFVRTWESFRWMLMVWVLGTVFVGAVTVVVDLLGIQVGTVSFQVASGGGRETGLGQQPNWYAMNLMFGVLPGFGLALAERVRWRQVGWTLAALFTLFMMLKSGSRGSAYALVIGAGAMALGNVRFRAWFVRLGVVLGGIFAAGIALNVGDSAKALMRIGSNVSIEQNYRPLNWQVCYEMFRNTLGRGIGAGGYEDLLPIYNNYLAQSLYDYPHGIFWDVLAHYGAIGIFLLLWLVVRALRMTAEMVRLARGTEAEIYVWTMAASLLGYAAWSWVEFTLAEKPFWEFLALYTALWAVLRRAAADGTTLPTWRTPARGTP